jgi:hypothetical protein
MSVWTGALPYFPVNEIACKCCGLVKIDLRFAAMLPALRRAWDEPLTPTSLCRCPAHNAKSGGHVTSLHLTDNTKWPTTGSAAVDIAWRAWPTAKKVAFARLAHRQTFRVGLHDGFCHLDLGRILEMSPKPFLYGTWTGAFAPEDIL